jgi:feruloyl esterase
MLCSMIRTIAAALAVLTLSCGPGLDEGDPPPDAATPDHAVTPDSGPDHDQASPDQTSGPDLWVCEDWEDNNYNHVAAKRAYICGGNACAMGSDDNLGLYNTYQRSTVRKTGPDYYEKGPCP